MAEMYPQTLLDSELKSKAEGRVFDALRDGLDDSWKAFHSVGWVTRDHAEGANDGEIDFILARAEAPIICLEVKGGGLESRHGEWFRIKDGQRERFRDPFAQALDHTYALRRKLSEFDGWKADDVQIVHALAFPDITVHKLVLAPDAPADIVIDRNGLTDVAGSLERVLGFHRGSRDKRKLLDTDGLGALRNILAPDITLEVPMATRFLDEEAALITLTAEQARILDSSARESRLAVYGCAGSGKTMLAVEQAKRLAANGEDVLFVCFNTGLKNHLREREASSGVEFWNFHALCRYLAGKAGVELPTYPKDEAPANGQGRSRAARLPPAPPAGPTDARKRRTGIGSFELGDHRHYEWIVSR